MEKGEKEVAESVEELENAIEDLVRSLIFNSNIINEKFL